MESTPSIVYHAEMHVSSLESRSNIGIISSSLSNSSVTSSSSAQEDSLNLDALRANLREAIAAGDRARISSLFDASNINVNIAIHEDGTNVLFEAVLYGHIEIVRDLLKRPDIDVNARNRRGWTPLILAAASGQLGMLEVLLAKPGVDVNLNPIVQFDTICMLPLGKGFGREEALRHIGLDFLDILNANEGQTPLFAAAVRGHTSIVRRLLQVEGIQMDRPNMWNYSPFMIAVGRGYTEIVDMLIQAGANLWKVNPNGSDFNMLMTAAVFGHTDIFQKLLPSFDVNAISKNGSTTLMLAASGGYTEIVRTLLSIPNININQSRKDARGNIETASSLADQYKHTEIVQILEEHARTNKALPGELKLEK